MRRVLVLILACVLVLPLLVFPAFATSTAPETEEEYWEFMDTAMRSLHDLVSECKSFLIDCVTYLSLMYTRMQEQTTTLVEKIEFVAYTVWDYGEQLLEQGLNNYNGIVAAISTEITRLSTELKSYIDGWKSQWVALYNNQVIPILRTTSERLSEIYDAIVGDASADDEMQDAMDDAASDAKDDLDVLDDVTMPVPDHLQGEIDVDALVDGNDVQMLTNCLSPILEGVVFLPVFMVCLVMSLAAYVLYGKR